MRFFCYFLHSQTHSIDNMAGGPGHCLQGFELKLIDANSRVYTQRVHERTFAAFEASGMALLLKNKVQAIPTMEDVCMIGWPHLSSVHKEQNVYQLFPRRAKSTRAFEVMMSVCAQPGAPFNIMTDRFDPTDTKLVLRSKEMDTVREYNKVNVYQYDLFPHIHFEGILASQKNKQVAFIMTAPHCTANTALNVHEMVDFVKFWLPKHHTDNQFCAKKLEALMKLCNDRPMMIFGSDAPPKEPAVVKTAADRGVFCMTRQMANRMRFVFLR